MNSGSELSIRKVFDLIPGSSETEKILVLCVFSDEIQMKIVILEKVLGFADSDQLENHMKLSPEK